MVVCALSEVTDDVLKAAAEEDEDEEEEEEEEAGEEEEDVDEQATAVGRSVTPEMAQNCCAKLVAVFWSASSHVPARQHAMSLKKVSLEQIHLMSVDEHPPMFEPVVNEVTQDFWV